MEAQTQTEIQNGEQKKANELRAENRRLKQELEYVKEKLNECQRESERLSKYIELLELVVNDLLSVHYQGRLKASFNNLELCTDDRCIAFNRYEDLLVGLRAAILLLK
jgi:predicted nuclease with TOPRIM domain